MGVRGFQLVLLRRMADTRPDLVDDARRALDASRTEMREANRRWQAFTRAARAPRGVRRYALPLGPPARVRDVAVGDLVCRAHHWPLPLWPELVFEVVTVAGGGVVQEWLVRDDGGAPPPLRTLADLAPWSCVVDDVVRAFPDARPLEGDAPSRWRLAFTALAGDGGRPVPAVADFTWGLLQRVTVPTAP
jgi:hypothetical protein